MGSPLGTLKNWQERLKIKHQFEAKAPKDQPQIGLVEGRPPARTLKNLQEIKENPNKTFFINLHKSI